MNNLIDLNTKTKKQAQIAVKNKLFNCRYSLNLRQEKLLKGILFLNQQVEHYDYADVIEVDKTELKKLMFQDSTHESDEKMYNVFQSIMSKVLRFRSVEGKEMVLTHWVQRIEFQANNEVQIVFSPEIVPILKEHGNFTLLDKNTVFGASKVWTERLYPMLKQYKDFGKREIYIEDIKKDWELKKSYSNSVGALIQKVINPAVEEINRLSDIWVSYTKIKKSRFVIGFSFKIKEKPQATITIDTTAKATVKDSIKKEILEWCKEINLDILMRLQQEDETTEDFEERLKRKLSYCKTQSPREPAKFFYNAVKNDYKINGVEQDIFNEEKEHIMTICGNCQRNEICNHRGGRYETNAENKIITKPCPYCVEEIEK